MADKLNRVVESVKLKEDKGKVAEKLNRVVVTLKQTEPGWKLNWNKPGKNDTMARWQSSDDSTTVTIVDYETSDKAVSAFRWDQKMMSNAPIPVPIKNVGDEAYLWNREGSRTASLHFRKGSMVVIVNATSPKVAKDFAGHVLKEL